MRCTLGMLATIPKAFARVRSGERSRQGRKEQVPAVIDAQGVEHAFPRKPLGRRVMHPEQGGHVFDREPAGPAEMLGEARNRVGGADVPYDQAGEALAGARPQEAAIERVGDLSIGLLG